MEHRRLLEASVQTLAHRERGILAADESHGTIGKRFGAIGVESSEEVRRQYRQMLFTSPDVGRYLAGVILYEETLGQKDDAGKPFVEVLNDHGILPGIKVDRGIVALPFTDGEKVAQGLDDLADRCNRYREAGARFTKWRAVYDVSATLPSARAIEANAQTLARYAGIAQSAGLVPIVEPEVLMDGGHDIGRCAEVTEAVQHAVFRALTEQGIALELIVLKPNMVVAGKGHGVAPPAAVAEQTLAVMRRTVPAAVPAINFLSGGQGPVEAAANLDAMNRIGGAPWSLSFSYARALQQPAMEAWAGRRANVAAAQKVFAHRLRMASLARQGRYSPDLERAA